MSAAPRHIRLIAADVDGTLTNRASSVSEANLSAIRKARSGGVMFTIATGRGRAASRKLIHLLELDGPVIVFGGAMILDAKTEETLYLSSMEWPLVCKVLEFAQSLQLHAQIYVGDTVIFERETDFSRRYTQFASLPYQIDPALRQKRYESVPKVLIYAPPEIEDRMRMLVAQEFSGQAGVSRSQPGYIEVNALGATKGAALRWVAERLQIPRSQVAAIGDSYLDMDMMRWAGLGACVEDGVQAAKEAADLIIPSCDEDGLGYFIEHYAL